MRHHGYLLAGESHPVHPAPSAFGARPRNLSSFTCPTQYGIEARGGGQAPRGDSAPFVTPPRFRQPSVIRLALPTRAFLDKRRILSTHGATRQDRAPVPLLTNHPAFCQRTSTPNAKGRFRGQAPSIAERPWRVQRIALGKMRGQRPSCRNSGAKTPESTVRGSLKARTRHLGTLRFHRMQ